jgi:hypothetical protein
VPYHELSLCEVLGHQTCTHFPVFQLAMNGAVRTTQRNALLSQVHVLCPLRYAQLHHIVTRSGRAGASGSLLLSTSALLLSNPHLCTQHYTWYTHTHTHTHTSPTTGHESPPVRKQSHEKQNRIPLCPSISGQVSRRRTVLTDIRRYDSLAGPSRGRKTTRTTYTYVPVT